MPVAQGDIRGLEQAAVHLQVVQGTLVAVGDALDARRTLNVHVPHAQTGPGLGIDLVEVDDPAGLAPQHLVLIELRAVGAEIEQLALPADALDDDLRTAGDRDQVSVLGPQACSVLEHEPHAPVEYPALLQPVGTGRKPQRAACRQLGERLCQGRPPVAVRANLGAVRGDIESQQRAGNKHAPCA